MIPARDPALMTPDERLGEVAELLGMAYLRLSESRQKALEEGHPPAALCHAVNAPENGAGKETAWKKA